LLFLAFIFFVIHALHLLLVLVELLLLLLILLQHHKVLLRGDVGGAVTREVGGREVEAVVVLSTEKELFLLLSQVSVRV
jgi:hypothetical protein